MLSLLALLILFFVLINRPPTRSTRTDTLFPSTTLSRSLTGLVFHFYARTKDWILLFLGDVALVVCTIGIGAILLQYRHWKFFVTHMGATGTIHTDELTQPQTKTSRHAEGLLDALDVGAFCTAYGPADRKRRGKGKEGLVR